MENRKIMKSQKNKYKKRYIWKECEERALIELWKNRIHDLRANAKHGKIFEEITQELVHQKINVTDVEVKCKINNLTTKYRKEKALMNWSSKWPLFSAIDETLSETNFTKEQLSENVINEADGSNMSAHPSTFVFALRTLPGLSTSSQKSSSQVSETSSPLPAENDQTIADEIVFKEEVLNGLNNTFQEIEQHLTNITVVDEELVALKRRKVELLEQRVHDGTELKNSVVNFLNILGDYFIKKT